MNGDLVAGPLNHGPPMASGEYKVLFLSLRSICSGWVQKVLHSGGSSAREPGRVSGAVEKKRRSKRSKSFVREEDSGERRRGYQGSSQLPSCNSIKGA